MEIRSRRRAAADPGSTEHLPESPVTRSSSDETLTLTVTMGDRAVGDVGHSHPEVRDSIRTPGSCSPSQEVSTIDGSQVPVREPVQILDAPQCEAAQGPFLGLSRILAWSMGSARSYPRYNARSYICLY